MRSCLAYRVADFSFAPLTGAANHLILPSCYIPIAQPVHRFLAKSDALALFAASCAPPLRWAYIEASLRSCKLRSSIVWDDTSQSYHRSILLLHALIIDRLLFNNGSGTTGPLQAIAALTARCCLPYWGCVYRPAEAVGQQAASIPFDHLRTVIRVSRTTG